VGKGWPLAAKGARHKAVGQAVWKSDEAIVVKKRVNKIKASMAELVERRASAERSPGGRAVAGTQRPAESDVRLARVREAAQRDRSLRFNNVLHHITGSLLERAYWALRKAAVPGVDEVDWHAYGEGLAERLACLHAAVQSGRYRPRPVRRQWIAKPDGRLRPLGVTCVEDKIVQQALVWVLEAIYEVDFCGFSYGFRPGRSQHDALDAVYMAITTRKVGWVLDADIEACFDRIEHPKLLAVLGRRLADRRVLHLIEQMLVAGVVDAGTWQPSTVGIPQGAVISPLLANVFLHDAIDRWVHGWRRRSARGCVSIVRYADDFVIGVQYRSDGERLRAGLERRLGHYGLTLHASKTRLLEFGRFAHANRAQRGAGKPESFDFLGFTHCCATRRSDGGFALHRRSIAKRQRAFLQKIKHELKQRYAWSVARQGAWLSAKVRGYFQYHGVPGNRSAMQTVRREVNRLWLRTLRRRSHRHDLTWARFNRWVRRWIPSCRIVHPYPNQRFAF
jgi:RNA-directed DNA polymerase